MYDALVIAKWFLLHNKEKQLECGDVEGLTNLKLQKLLYYAQGCYLALYGVKLFADPILAWQHGPVVEKVYQAYKKYKSLYIEESQLLGEPLDAKAVQVLTWVYEEFGQYTGWALRNMTHRERPWKETQLASEIKPDLMREFFLEKYVEA